jgi:hypothetical protein
MVDKITDKTLYHVTAEKPYKRPLVADQVLKVGEDANPFFGFYEGAREYPVPQDDGSTVNFKAGAFLAGIRDGRIRVNNPAAVSMVAGWGHEISSHFCMLVRELVMEDVRREVNPEAPSRQRCMYLCETPEEAQYWNQRIGDNGKVCSLRCTGSTHRGDAGLLLGDSEPLSVTRGRAASYWRGEVSEKKEWETLFVGDAVVTGIGL